MTSDEIAGAAREELNIKKLFANLNKIDEV